MKLAFQQATISFCVDLASPSAESIPVANLLVGESEGRLVAGVAVLVPDNLDPLAKAVLGDTHQLVRQYVDEAFERRPPAAPLGEVLARVDRSLRNSMHVSSISEPAEVEIGQSNQLGGTVLNLLHDGLVQALTDAGLVVDAQTPPVVQPMKPMRSRASSLDMLPSFIWEPPPPAEGLAAAAAG